MIGTWYILKKINPSLVIESGIYKGQSSWLLEKTCPEAKVISLDIDFSNREYISNKIEYIQKDFSLIPWGKLPENTVAFFDDHQNAYERVQLCKSIGIHNIIFEDNYPLGKGDCLSMKKIFDTWQMFNRLSIYLGNNKPLASLLMKWKNDNIGYSYNDYLKFAKYLFQIGIRYNEFPPMVIKEKTRWGDNWRKKYPTNKMVLNSKLSSTHIFNKEADNYTWISHVRI